MFQLDIYVIYALLFKDQLERRVTQATQLRDLLHLIGEKPLIPNVEKRIARVRGCSAHLMNVCENRIANPGHRYENRIATRTTPGGR